MTLSIISPNIYLSPVKTQLVQYNRTLNLMLLSNKKHASMVLISRKYLFGADKAVQISLAVFFSDKGTQPEHRPKIAKSSY